MPAPLRQILRLLSHGEFVSGEAIARALGCSRATVHNALGAALEQGIGIHAVRGRGYRLAQPLSWLDGSGLERALAYRAMPYRQLEQVDSTNTYLLGEAQAGAPHRLLVAAEMQTAGRGRRGRAWLGGRGQGLAFSMLWRSGRPAAELSGLSLAVGVSLTRALQGLGLERARVKWPNDIVVLGEGARVAKVAGVLIELTGDMLGPSAAVIGVGVNVHGGAELSARVGQPVTDLGSHLGPVERGDVLLALARALDEDLARFEAEGFAPFRDPWHACHAYQDRPVLMATVAGETVSGVALGVDEHGALLLRVADGVRRFHSGEVSLRGAEA